MGKLHEILAVMTDLESTAKKVRDEAINTFSKKTTHFTGHHKTLKMFDDERKNEEEGAEEHKSLVTTVPKKLEYIKSAQEKHWDAVWQLEKANQKAVADLVVDGKVLISDCPATFLLGLESKLKAVRAVFEATPTLDPGTEWILDESEGEEVYKTKYPDTTQKQEKAIRHQVLVQPTEHHPAQIEKWTENVVVGTYSVKRLSGMISPGEKSNYLKRIDNLIQATKQARQRANTAEIVNEQVANKLFEYILK